MNDIVINEHTGFWELIESEVDRYTNGQSSSVPKSVAEDIVKSIVFSINEYLSKHYLGDWCNVPEGISLNTMLGGGRNIVLQKINYVKRLYSIAVKTKSDIPNLSYHDTLNELNNFFHLYDYKFGAHEVPCMIDYQLMSPVEEAEGINFISTYIERYVWETGFFTTFDNADLVNLYVKYAHDYKEQLINLCDPVYANAIGSIICKSSCVRMKLTQDEQHYLRDYLLSCDKLVVEKIISDANITLCKEMGFGNKAITYFDKAGKELSDRVNLLKFGDGLENVFIVCV